MLLLTLLAAVALAAVHVVAAHVPALHRIPRSALLSAAGGASVAYVFLHLLPELAVGGEVFVEALHTSPLSAEQYPFLVAAGGLAVFYALEYLARRTRRARQGGRSSGPVERRVFRIHIGSFALYNLLVGYLLLHREESGVLALVLYAAAMGMHFLVNDVGLRDHHREHYDRRGRWIVAAAVLAGWALGAAADVPEIAVLLLLSFLAGGVVLNVLKEELPEERESRLSAFLLGLGAYAALLLVV